MAGPLVGEEGEIVGKMCPKNVGIRRLIYYKRLYITNTNDNTNDDYDP